MILTRLILSPFKEKVNLLAKQKAALINHAQTEGNNKKAEFH